MIKLKKDKYNPIHSLLDKDKLHTFLFLHYNVETLLFHITTGTENAFSL